MLDKPLIQYPIDIAKGCDRLAEVWVNTESEELGRFAQQHGVSFHKRPPELSTDKATNREFTYQFLQEHACDYVVMINPTSPALMSETLEHFIDMVESTDYDTILSVVEEKTACFYDGAPINFPLSQMINSQLLVPVERTVWALTAWKRSAFIYNQEHGINPTFGGNLATFPIPKDESCDLDTEEDWRIAESVLLARTNRTEPRYLELR